MSEGRIHSVETFGSADGPGVRFVIFLQGCDMRCLYFHNADTWDLDSGYIRSADEILNQAERYRGYWGKDGGITVSGGEALLQMDFLLELFREAKKRGINTCLDTSGQPFTREENFYFGFMELMKYTDLLIVDIKHTDREEHIKLTGRSNDNIRDMLKLLSDMGKPVWIRYILVPGITDREEDLHAARSFIDTLSNVSKVELLPYHAMGASKWEKRGIPYLLSNVEPPEKNSIEKAREILVE